VDSLSAGNVISIVMALAWIGGVYAYWRRNERSEMARKGPTGGAGPTEEAEGPKVG